MDEFQDLKNRLVNLSTSKQHHRAKNHRFEGLETLTPLTFDMLKQGEATSSQQLHDESVLSIEDATGRLSNLVRLMDENSKLLQPSDLTVESYKSSILQKTRDVNFAEMLNDQKLSSVGKLNNILYKNDFEKGGLDSSSFEQTNEGIEDLLKDQDHKLYKQLDDLKYGSLAR